MHAWPPLAGRPHKRGSRLFLNWVFTSRERPKIASAPIWAASDADPRCAFFKGRDHGLTCSRQDDRRPRRSSRITRRAGCRFHHRYARQHDPAAPHERCAGLLARDLRAESLHLGPRGDANGRPAAARAARPGPLPADGARWRPLLRDGRRCSAQPRGRAGRRRRRQRRNCRTGRRHPRGGASRRVMADGLERKRHMSSQQTAIVTGASQGIGAALVEALLNAGYNVVATSRTVTQSLAASSNLVLAEEDIGKKETATKVVVAAMENFGSIDLLVTNAGIFSTKPFTEFTTDDFNALVSTNLLGFLYITQLAVEQMLKQKSGAVVSITAALADQPIAGVNAAVPMITKGGLNAVIKSLAIEYAKDGIRFNAVAPGIVDTPLHEDNPKDFLKTLQPMGKMAHVNDVTDAVLYLANAGQVSGEVLHVDGGSHAGRW